MKRLLYIALADLQDETSGVSKKVIAQCEGFRKNGFNVSCAAYLGEKTGIYNPQDLTAVKVFKDLPVQRYSLLQGIFGHLKNNKYQVCYIRYPFIDIQLFKILKLLKKNNTKVYIEIPTYPIPISKTKNLFKRFIFLQDKWFRGRIFKYVDKIISIGNHHTEIWQIPVINIPNGIDVSKFPLKKFFAPENELHILTVSVMGIVHGYDRMIRGLANYYNSNSTKTKVFLHMVGTGDQEAYYQQLVEENNLNEYVKFYGVLSGEALDDLYDRCQLGCGPLAMFRGNCNTASPLKTKEYMARGLPFIYAYEEIGISEDYPSVLRVKAEESVIDLIKILKFYCERNNMIQEVGHELRKRASDIFDWSSILKIIS